MNKLAEDWWGRDFWVGDDDEIRQFAQSIKDRNPLHQDTKLAVMSGLRGIIAPGVMTVGFASSAIADSVPGAMLRRIEMEFNEPLYAGARPSVLCQVLRQRKQVADIAVTIRNEGGVAAEGQCRIVLPRW